MLLECGYLKDATLRGTYGHMFSLYYLSFDIFYSMAMRCSGWLCNYYI